MSRTPRILYVSYDGILEPLGESQVIGYLEPLARCWPIHLVSFEKPGDLAHVARMRAMKARLSCAGVDWTPLRYHKSPSAIATSWDIVRGIAAVLAIAHRHGVGIVHARSYVPAIIALAAKRLTGARFLFDMRGFWADERVDGGLWPRDGRLYKTAKVMERRFLLAADHVVTLTSASAREISRFDFLGGRLPPITVIPTCTDLDRFKPRAAEPGRPFTLGYVGSVGTWYLLNETLAFFNLIRVLRPEARLLVVNRGEHAWIREAVKRAGIPSDRIEIHAVDHAAVPKEIARMHAGMALIKPCYSKIASAATKVAEYLGCGIPCIGNFGVGDMEEVLEGHRVGVALKGFSDVQLKEGVDRLFSILEDADTSRRCVDTARLLFSRESGVAAYDRIYRATRLQVQGI